MPDIWILILLNQWHITLSFKVVTQDGCSCMRAKLLWSCLTLCSPMDYSPPGASVNQILQARMVEWVSSLPPGDLPDLGTELESLMSPVGRPGLYH